MVDIPGNSTTTSSITVGGTSSDALELVGDHDWFRISLTTGQSISVSLDGITLEDPYLRIYNSSGQLLYENDDINAGINRDSLIAFTANYTGTYYIDVGGWDDNYAGTYQLSVSTYTPPPVATIDQIADQLVNGYWGGDDHHFNVTQGGSITVNLTALTAAGQALAVAALQTWTDIIGVSFVQVASGGQIVFDDSQEGAFSDSNWSNGIISSSHVNVSTDWLANYGTGLNSYSFQTYIHEVGHALGLGHAGNYNGDAQFPYDALFYNDGWPVSVMSYFSQLDSSYYSGQGFDENYLVTPMLADIIAMSTLYGLSTTTRTGDTIYGFNSNAGNAIYNANLYPNVAYTIYDSGGIDTLDYSGFGNDLLINLNPETFSNVGFNVGNVVIARGVVIENAIGGAGNDTIIGNTANNVLSGGAGEDSLSYETATAGVHVNLTTTAQQDTIGAGRDTLSGFERLTGSAYNDTLTGSSASIEIHGGDGNDLITSTGSGSHGLYGDNGDDWIAPGQGDDWINGGDGFDTVDYSGATGSINAATDVANNNTGNSGFDTIGAVEKIIGSNFNDTLWAFQVGHQVWGGGGNDTLKGSAFGASQLHGGAGNDTYEVWHSANQITEVAGEGIDHVVARANFTLGENVENLTLYQPPVDTDPYDGATPGYETPANLNGTGNDLANVITGNGGHNVLAGLGGIDTLIGGEGNDALDGGADADTMAGGLGNDTYVVDNAADAVTESSGQGTDIVLASISWMLGSNLENLTLTGSNPIAGTGNALDNIITGNGAANQIFGLAGNDQLYGGGGDDHLTGGTGTDVLDGQEGSDVYWVDELNEHVTAEFADSGTNGIDEVRFGSYSPGTLKLFAGDTGIETIIVMDTSTLNVDASAVLNPLTIWGSSWANILTGTAFGDTLLGGGAMDRLIGGAGNDLLDGGADADKLFGGTGDDIYIVDHASDIVVESAGEGTDLVRASVNHTLRDHVENIELTGIYSIYANGNALDNRMTGNSGSNKLYGLGGNDVLIGLDGNDTLDGGVGADQMAGGDGNDQYYVDDVGDTTIEEMDDGIDTVRTTINVALAANIENLVLLGSGNIGATGNDLNNVMTGNGGDNAFAGGAGVDQLKGLGGNDVLDGGVGSDRLYGGTGDDSYIVDTTGDLIFENGGEGIDTVLSTGTYVLAANVENLEIGGVNNANGTGNELDNRITGNGGVNILTGNGGHDVLDGAAGADVLKGGTGNDQLDGGSGRDRFYGEDGADTFIFNDGDLAGLTSSTCDQIHDFSQLQGDKIGLAGIDANTSLAGDQGFSFLGSGAFTGTAGELRTYQSGGNTYVTGDTNGDGVADFMIRLDGLHTLQVSDFII